jgi:hypothetical protein
LTAGGGVGYGRPRHAIGQHSRIEEFMGEHEAEVIAALLDGEVCVWECDECGGDVIGWTDEDDAINFVGCTCPDDDEEV